jgi:hypothetical protein
VLIEHDVGFDLACEEKLVNCAKEKGFGKKTRLVVGNSEYSTVIICGATTLRSSTIALLTKYGKRGGNCVFAGFLPTAIDGNETDIIVATSHDEAENYLELEGGVVDLAFEHILSQLEVQITYSSFITNEYRLNTLAYRNVPSASGVATYKLDYTEPSRSAMGEVEMATSAITIANSDEGIVIRPEGEEMVSFKHLVVPFQTDKPEGIEIDIDYSVNGKKRNTTVATQLKALEAGKRYVLRLTFSSNGIDIVPVIYINEWVDEEMDEDPKYNW